MSKFKGTPGPWKWVELEFCRKYHVLQDQFGVVICDDGSASGEYSPEIDVNGANAQLIAAAPELLEALIEVTVSLAWNAHGECRAVHEGPIMPSSQAVEVAKAAIAKAIGGDAP